jgi:hypothetical protein
MKRSAKAHPGRPSLGDRPLTLSERVARSREGKERLVFWVGPADGARFKQLAKTYGVTQSQMFINLLDLCDVCVASLSKQEGGTSCQLEAWDDVVEAPLRPLTEEEYQRFLRGESPVVVSSKLRKTVSKK